MTSPRPVRPVGLDRRGVIVRLDLEADVVVVVELHHARVVREDAHAPVILAEFLRIDWVAAKMSPSAGSCKSASGRSPCR